MTANPQPVSRALATQLSTFAANWSTVDPISTHTDYRRAVTALAWIRRVRLDIQASFKEMKAAANAARASILGQEKKWINKATRRGADRPHRRLRQAPSGGRKRRGESGTESPSWHLPVGLQRRFDTDRGVSHPSAARGRGGRQGSADQGCGRRPNCSGGAHGECLLSPAHR